MKLADILNNIVFITSGDMTALLDTGILPPAVVARAVARGHVPDTRVTPARSIEQATYFVNYTAQAVDVPGLYTVSVKCIDDGGDYPVRIEVAELDWC